MNEKWENLTEYYRSIEREILLRSEKVRLLIGNRHWLTDGRHKEELIKNVIVSYCGDLVDATNGFVSSFLGSGKISPEIDVLVLNRGESACYYKEAGVNIVPPSKVIAHLHVKTTLSLPAIKNVFRTAVKTNEAIGQSADQSKVFSAGVFFRTPAAIDNNIILKWAKSEVKACSKKELLPHSIFLLGKGNITFTVESSRVRIALFSFDHLSVAWMISEIIDSLRQSEIIERNDIAPILLNHQYSVEYLYVDI